jgi:hypothetical protein
MRENEEENKRRRSKWRRRIRGKGTKGEETEEVYK